MTDTSRLYAGGQIVGRRKRQEDEYGIFGLSPREPDKVLLAVADGMGGHAGGTEFAQTAVTTFLDAFHTSDGDTAGRLRRALDSANSAIVALKDQFPALEDGGCTLVAAVIEGETLSWISIGDSSLLRLRNGELHRLNADHSMRPVLQELVSAGRMTTEDMQNSPNRNALRSALIGEAIELVDAGATVELEPGDQVLLSSDGLDVLSPERIAELLENFRDREPQEAVKFLLAAVEAENLPRQDNTTVVLYRATGSSPRQNVASSDGRIRQSGRKRIFLAALVMVLFFAATGVAWLLVASSREHSPWSNFFIDHKTANHGETRKSKP